jgi:hypothetical protein
MPIIQHDYADLIGSRLRVEYADQSESFAAFMPFCGTVRRQVAIHDWGSDWLVLQLDDPFVYQTFSQPQGYRGHRVSHILVRSRWAGCPVGGTQTSVFVLLDLHHVLDEHRVYVAADFFLACWGIVPSHSVTRTA